MGGWSRLVFLGWRDPIVGHTSSRTEYLYKAACTLNLLLFVCVFDSVLMVGRKRRSFEVGSDDLDGIYSQLEYKTDKSNHTYSRVDSDARWVAFSCFVVALQTSQRIRIIWTPTQQRAREDSKIRKRRMKRMKELEIFCCQVNNVFDGESPLLVKEKKEGVYI